VEPPPEGTRASENGQVPSSQTYEDWLRRQPPDAQDEIVGPARADLFRQGKIGLRDLVRGDRSVVTVRELEQQFGRSPDPAQKDWAPSMSREDAEAWARPSAIQGDFFHGTSLESAEAIGRGGFDLSAATHGRQLGDGVYVAGDRGLADRYAEGGKALTLKLDLRNPLRVDAESLGMQVSESIGQKLLPSHGEYRQRIRAILGRARAAQRDPSEMLLTELLREQGYDGVVVYEAGSGRSAINQVMIMDPQRVVVVR
jgi:hypothetical protein